MARKDPRLTSRYTLAKPIATHRRPATCAEAGCKYLRNGWQVRVMPNTPLGARQVHLIVQSKRRFILTRNGDGSHLYSFEPGQNCFGAHTVPIQRPALYIVRQGSNQPTVHRRPEDWVDEFSTQLDKIREQ